MTRKTIREKAAARDGGIGKLGTPGVYWTVEFWNWPSEWASNRGKGVNNGEQHHRDRSGLSAPQQRP